MAFKVFLDVNIILDLTLKREAYAEAEQIFERIISGQIQGFITPAVVHMAGYWLTKYYGVGQAKKLLLLLLTDVKVIDISHEITIAALNSKINDIEDALQYYTAIHHKLDCFILRDKRLKKDSLPILPVYTSSEFLKEFV